MESEDMTSLNFDRAENYNSIQMKRTTKIIGLTIGHKWTCSRAETFGHLLLCLCGGSEACGLVTENELF